MPDEKALLSVKEVSDILNISTTTIWRHVQAKSFPQPVKIGRSTRWRRADIEAIFQPTNR